MLLEQFLQATNAPTWLGKEQRFLNRQGQGCLQHGAQLANQTADVAVV